MLIKPGEHVYLARLLSFLVLGEQLAHDCARAQMNLTSEPGMKKFLAGQARQEGYHAVVFQGASRWLAPRAPQCHDIMEPMEQYRRNVMAAIGRQDFVETIIAEQIILEGLGEAILKILEKGLVKRGAPFQTLRRTLIHQEEAHHAFGLRIINRMLARDEESPTTLNQRAQGYLSLAETLVFSAHDAFKAIDEDANYYWSAFQRNLPPWLQPQNDVVAL